MIRKIITIFLLILILASNTPSNAIIGPYNPPKDTADLEALKFVRALGNARWELAYRMMTDHARKNIAKYAMERFSDLDGCDYQLYEMEHLLRTNEGGHRTVVFEDLTTHWCDQTGINYKDLKNPQVVFIKEISPKEKKIWIKAGNIRISLTMKNEFNAWKAAWYPISQL